MELYEEGMALCRESGYADILAQYLASMGETFLFQGELQRATGLLEESAVLLCKEVNGDELVFALDVLGWAKLLQGDHERAKALHEESLALCWEWDNKSIAADSLEGLACAAEMEGKAERASRLFGAARALREAVGARQPPEQRDLRQPYLTSARSQLGETTWEAVFAEGQAMTFEESVEYALSEEQTASASSPAPDQPLAQEQPPALTHREREVAELIGRGLTNRRIAEELFLSERTVHRHVSCVLKKLGVTLREQVGAKLAELQAPNTD